MRCTLDHRMGKRGSGEYIIENLFRIGVLAAALLIFFGIINSYVNTKVDSQYLQAQTLAYRILYSDTIMYGESGIARTYPGIVDLSKFNDESLDKGLSYGQYKRHASAKLKIESNIPIGSSSTIFVKEAYLNKEQYNKMVTLIRSIPSGKGSATMYITKYPITYFDGHNYDYGNLVVEIIIPNS